MIDNIRMKLRDAIEKALYHYNARKSYSSGMIDGRDKVGLTALLEASLQEYVTEAINEEVALELEVTEEENNYLYALVKYILTRTNRKLSVSFDKLKDADRYYLIIDKTEDNDLRLEVKEEWEDGDI